MKISKTAIDKMEGSGRLMNLIAAEVDKTESTVRRWIANNDPMLTTASVLEIICRETGLSRDQVLTEEIEAA